MLLHIFKNNVNENNKWTDIPTSGKVRIQGKELGIAAAIMEKPEILILDEPLNALDTNGVELFTKIINEEKEK